MADDEKTGVPEALKAQVVSIGPPVSSDDVDTYGKLREIEDRSYKLRTVLGAWERQQAEERPLRQTYARWLLFGVFAQVVAINAAFFLIGFGKMEVAQWVAATFIAAVFAEVSAMTMIVVRYLFPDLGSEVLKLIERL